MRSLERIPLHDHSDRNSGGKIDANASTTVVTSGGSGGGSSTTTTTTTGGSLPWFNIKDYGALVDGSTDDTVAVQATITAATAVGGGVIYHPGGTCVIGGALRDTGQFNGQLLLPTVSTSSTQVVLEFRGALRPGLEWIGGGSPIGTGLSVYKSTLTGASGSASCVSGGPTAAGYLNWNNVSTRWRDLVFQAPDNPTFTMLNLEYTQGGGQIFDHVQISTPGGFAGSATQPTHTNAYGVKMPRIGTSNYSGTEALSIGGFYTCLLDGELGLHRGMVLGICIVGSEIPHLAYPPTYVSVTMTAYQYGFRGTGASPINVLSFVGEHTTTPAWMVTVYDIDDPSNYLTGLIHWYCVNGTTAAIESATKNGGSNIVDWQLTKIGPASGVTPGSYTATNLTVDTYGRITAASSGSSTAQKRILLADGHATPFVFTDLLQADDGSDFLYEDA